MTATLSIFALITLGFLSAFGVVFLCLVVISFAAWWGCR